MEKNFNLEIISPESILLSEKVNSVTIPSFEGEMTILADHIPLITFLRPGVINIEEKSEERYFVEEGIVEFNNNNLLILTSTIKKLNDLNSKFIDMIIKDSKEKIDKDNISDKEKYLLSHKIDILKEISQ